MQPEAKSLREYLAPLGVPLLIIADDPQLLATAVAAYAEWRSAIALDPVLELRLGLGTTASNDVSCRITVEGSRLTLTGAAFSGRADALIKSAVLTVPPALVGQPGALAELTDTLLLFLLARSGRAPVHAAGILVGETALILAGPSGSGKSSLALEAMNRGLGVLSDDTVYVQTDPQLAVWGLPRPIHVFPENAPPGEHSTRLRGDRLKAAVARDATAAPLVAHDARMILLERGGDLALATIPPDEATASLGHLEPGFDLLPDESATAARALVAAGAWRLTLGGDPGAAIALLCTRFG